MDRSVWRPRGLEDKHWRKTRSRGWRTLFAILGEWLTLHLSVLKINHGKDEAFTLHSREEQPFIPSWQKTGAFSLPLFSLPSLSLSLSAVERTAKFKLSCGNPNEIIDPGKYQWMLKLPHETEYLHGICFLCCLNDKPLKIHVGLKYHLFFCRGCKLSRAPWTGLASDHVVLAGIAWPGLKNSRWLHSYLWCLQLNWGDLSPLHAFLPFSSPARVSLLGSLNPRGQKEKL